MAKRVDRQYRTEQPKLVARFAVLLAFGPLLLSSCAVTPDITEAYLSVDEMRLEVGFNYCGEVPSVTVRETPTSVSLSIGTVSKSPFSGTDCLESVIIELGAPLNQRVVTLGVDGEPISLIRTTPDDVLPQYDDSRFTEQEWEAALDSMVRCMEAEDEEVEAEVIQQLNWKWFSWDKPADSQGTVSTDSLEPCEMRHLVPLQP